MYIKHNDGIVSLQEAITMATVNTEQYRRFCQEVANAAVHTVDLSAVKRADSACVSLLLAAIRIKKAQQQTLQLTQMPADLRALAALYEIDTWIAE